MEEILLTVYCLAYNHERYIRKTLEGFIEQKTKYKYKVIVHDDASTDGTRNIIEEFAKKYPDIFITIYQKNNQYAQGKIFERFIQPLVNTKYIACCEGDDYWCDENKIQEQLDYLESHPECSMCVHNTALINESGHSLNKNINNLGMTVDFVTDDVIVNRYFHTSSYMYRSEIRKNFPEEFYIKGVGDYPLMVFLSLHGYIHFIDKVMSCYRVGAINSWSSRAHSSVENIIKNRLIFIEALRKMNIYTANKYNISFNKAILYYQYSNILLQKKYWMILKDRKLFILFIKQCIPVVIKNIIKRQLFNRRMKNGF